ncbi:MAG: ChaN family lipoprotein [Nitrospirota bacterium]
MKYYKKIKDIILITVFFLCFSSLHAYALHSNQLDVDIDVDSSLISGTSRIGVSAGEELILHKGTLKIDNIQLDGIKVDFKEQDGTVKIIPSSSGTIEISFRGFFRDSPLTEKDIGIVNDVIDDRGVSLTGVWYPNIDGLSHHDLRATLPKGFEAVSEADTIRRKMKNGKAEFHFDFQYPVDSINLIASNRFRVIKDEFRYIEIYAYFFPEDINLAKQYIEYTKKYLEMYEGLIGEYPYSRFSIVENFLPSGYSMPAYTLLGSTVVRLPFIVETSLGHEILHQWFGNHLYIDYEKGNWAEGLTTYLADHYYKVLKGEGWKYRKQMLVDYKSYVSVKNDFPLKFFTGRVDRASRAIGYGKVSMVFHMLRNITGKDIFFNSLKELIVKNRFKKVSWSDIRASFEKVYGQDLGWFFAQWTEKDGIPKLEIEDVEVKQIGSRFELDFNVNHKNTFYNLNLPVTIYIKDIVKMDTLRIENEENRFHFVLPDKPDRIVLDEDYDIARDLQGDEFAPVIARLLGDDKLIIALPQEGKDIYRDIINTYEKKNAVIKEINDINESDLKSSSIIVLGRDNQMAGKLFGAVPHNDAGFSIEVRENPWNTRKIAGIINGTSKVEVGAAFRKIRHYGKYSSLSFNGGRNTAKEISESSRGIVMDMQQETSVIDISSLKTLADVINGIVDKRVIYVGEVHDVFAHHAVQLDIITGLYRKSKKLAIGMEMFQRPFQDTLDSFVNGSMGEQEFLKNSEYFKRWGFNYNLYKPIIDFARTEKVPLIALNLQREIIEKVSRHGLDSLSDEERKAVPLELDFSDSEYRERLEEIFSFHKHPHKSNFDYFYQSQILWDETMSGSVAEFLEKNPDHQVLVLAGQGHLQYGSGIPKRTFRRNGLDYAVVLIDDKVDREIADYVVFPKPVEGIATPKLMVFLKTEEGVMQIAGFPDMSVSEAAGLKVDDSILFIDDVEIKTIDDIKIYLLYKRKGDMVKVKIMRRVSGMEKEMVIEVEL